MSTLTLPSSLHEKLTRLASRLARLRLMRQAAGTIATLALLAVISLVADSLVDLPRILRGLMSSVWLAVAVWGFVRCYSSWRKKDDAEALAALIETTYPNLAERLTTAVELTENRDAAHGCPALIELLLRETEIRASRLDFLQAAPEKPTRLRVILGALALVLLAAPLILWPRDYAEKIRRFAMPWSEGPVPYELRYSQEDVAIARGQPLTLAAHLVPIESDATLPKAAWLCIRDEQGRTRRVPMTQEQSNVFHIRLKEVQESFEYRIEAGRAVGSERRVRVVDPVKLEVDSPTIRTLPPEYARGETMPPVQQGMFDLSCLQFSRLTYDFRFDRPATKAFVTWTAEDSPAGRKTDLQLSPDGKSARLELLAERSGRLALTIVGDEDVRTEVPAQMINVVVDRAPAFARSVGTGEQIRVLSTEDKLDLDIAIVDDIGVGGATLEFRVDGGPIQSRPLTLEGVGTPQAQARFSWRLADHARDGQVVQFRIRATDNRNVPEVNLGPQSVYAPAENRWFSVKLTREAQPLREQEITAQRDEIRKRLDEIIEELHGERRRLYKARAEANQTPQITPDVAEQLRDLRKEHQQNEKSLDDLARHVDQIAELRSLAHRLQDVSDQEMRQTATALASAERERQASAPRDTQLGQADQSLESALEKLEELKQQNERVAQQRLDQMRVEQLSEREQRLAEQVASSSPEKQAELANEQAALENELNALMNSSEPLRQALRAAQAQRAQELAEKAKELAHEQRELAQAIDRTQQEFMRGWVKEFAEKQRQLAEEANQLGRDTQNALAAAQSRPLESDKARDAAKELEQGNIADALSKQEQSAQELDRLANDLQRAIDLARDPKEVARQLARWQNDLKNRVTDETKDAAPDPVDPERLAEWQKEQGSLRQAVSHVPVPEKDTTARRDKQEALDRAADAGRELSQGDTAKATANMEKARQAIERLADQLPNMQQRWAAARDEVHRLRKQQEELARQGEHLATQADPNNSPDSKEQQTRLADVARKQADVLDRFNRLDLPGFEPRQQRIRQALEQALDDLQAGQRADAAIAQSEAKRQLERLEQALNGQQPVDEKVAELARRQEDLAARAKRNRQSTESAETRDRQAQQLAEEQKRLTQEAANVPPTEASQRQSQAVEAARQADAASRQGSEPFAEAAAQAARRLAEWARQLNQGEADAARAERLAKQLRELANQAEQMNAPRNLDEFRKKQQPIEEETRQIRSGPEASREKQKAADALAQLSRTPAERLPAGQRQAADALQELADRLARSQADSRPEASSPRSAEELARAQQQLMEQTRQARRESAQSPAEQSGQTAKDLARRQGQLRNDAARLTRLERTNALNEARDAMRQAERALDRGDWEQGEQQQRAATQALERLAREVAQNRPAPVESNPAGLPRSEQVDQARRLAHQQRELRDAVQRAVSQRTQQDRDSAERMLHELTQEQKAIAEAAAEMARRQQSGTPQAQRAQDAAANARQARQQLENGAFNAARQSGESSSEQLRRLAEASEGAQARDAEGLAQRQDSLNQRLARLIEDPIARQAQQGLRQQELRRQADELSRQLAQQAERTQGEPSEALRQAAQAAQRAQNSMQQAQRRQEEGNATARRLAQRFAARDLDRAASAAQRASGQPANEDQAPPTRRQLGSALQQAQAQMREAREQLGQNQPQDAQQAMKNAAQALQQAARSFDSRNSPGRTPQQVNGEPQNDGSASGAAIDLTRYGPDATKYKGKPWGELPGELRTRIIQDMKAQFGEDYGRMIKLYFEQIADRKPMDGP